MAGVAAPNGVGVAGNDEAEEGAEDDDVFDDDPGYTPDESEDPDDDDEDDEDEGGDAAAAGDAADVRGVLSAAALGEKAPASARSFLLIE